MLTSRALVALFSFTAGLWILFWTRARHRAQRTTVWEQLTGTPPAPTDPVDHGLRELRRLAGPVLRRLRELTPAGYHRRVEASISRAGASPTLRPEDIAVVQGVLGALAVAATLTVTAQGLLSSRLLPIVLIGALATGIMTPMVLLERAGRRRVDEVRLGVPDLLDLMALSVAAGMAFDAALGAVATRIRGPLAAEINQVLTAMSLGQPREQALEDLQARLSIDEVSDFVLAVNHASSVGAPIGPVLDRQARSARVRRRQIKQERINRLPVKMLVPTTLFILPPTLIIVIGPAMSDIVGMFS